MIAQYGSKATHAISFINFMLTNSISYCISRQMMYNLQYMKIAKRRKHNAFIFN